ncbi:hypothetical protein SPRG_07814 [Saprolegnia parasitica CBS 223.65]|uniref:Uncharacterized protein n=1 Tax=Saprolegnia parasitica (strain CBS 223.65) TaxID=695850 RepID=A0A067C9C5_SAPPC|nr:hypothetical protein SPRG_07814 [Saprolegnia parasitica CBS 223.65]KDO27103.1 hypothetical protein SPRG_07814 [Saprolegnia parasitica CBS 223.65]|eukprot:XP_012202196.1 hypothetical protein SPRG_07814 [Saprolegnia parasitica CBS 223.65]
MSRVGPRACTDSVRLAGPVLPTLVVTTRQRLVVGASLVYVAASLAAGVRYLQLLQPSFANDLWWAGYNVSGHQAFLIDLVNQFLVTQSNGALDILASSSVVAKTYTSVESNTSIYPSYIRRMLLGELTSIEYAVPHLRKLSTYWCMRMNVQHCWVDFNKTFEMAHTLLRQERCERNYRANAAVYLEAILRNQPWDAYLALWGGNGLRFNMATAANTTSVADELAYWRSHKFSRFELQWQRMQQSYTLKALDQVTGPWSSQSLFWMPLNDLYCGMIMNRSFVRGTSRHFGANISASLPSISLVAWQGIVVRPGITKSFYETIGPYISIDCMYIAPPPALLSALDFFQKMLRTGLEAPTNETVRYTKQLRDVSVHPWPRRWRNLTFHGGDPSCTSSTPSSFVQDQFGFFNDCTRVARFNLALTTAHLMWAAWVTARPPPSSICAYTTASHCATSMAAATSLQANLPPIPTALLSAILAAIDADTPRIMQFASSANGTMQLLTQALLPRSEDDDDDDDAWTFFGWCFLYDWATGAREVVSFRGDVSSMTLLSSAYESQAYVTSDARLQVATSHLYFVVLASSSVLVLLGFLLLVYAIHCGLRLQSGNVLMFNRLVGGVWLGRALMAFRGLTALVLQSASQLSLRRRDSHSFLVLSPRSWLDTAIVASEATWLSYSLHEFLLIGWPNAVAAYGPSASYVLWVVLCAIDVAVPVLPTAAIQRTCVGNDMDYGLVCSAGSLRVGSLERFLLLLALELLAAILPVVLGRRRRRQASAAHQSLLLPAVGQAFLVPLSTHDATIAVDKASCVLLGLLPFRWFGERYVFALRSWTLLRDTTSIGPAVLLEGHVPDAGSTRMVVAEDTPEPTRLLYRARRVVAAFGFLYVVSSIVSSVSFLEVSRVNLSNDFFWPNFNVTGHHAFFANWLNEQLVLLLNNQNIVLDDASINLFKSFATPTAYVSTVHNYGAWLQHNELSSIEASIAGLRVSDACNAPWIFTPYCYLDWKKTWPMAYSHQRQMRCQKMESNAAVYLESVLRNIDWATFEFCWGNAFETAFGLDLRQSSEGVEWLHAVSTERLSLHDEITLWGQHNLSTFQVQWQNYKRIGAINSYAIVNAFGISYPMTLLRIDGGFRIHRSTSYKMYWSLANDLDAITTNASRIGGRSLLRTSARFAFQNSSLQSVLSDAKVLNVPLSAGLTLLTQELGPFGMIDMVYVPVPALVSAAIRAILHATRVVIAMKATAQTDLLDIATLSASYPIPRVWGGPNYASYGGSPLCAEYSNSQPVGTAGFSSLPSFDLPCSSSSSAIARIIPTRQHYITSAVLSGVGFKNASQVDVPRLCVYDANNKAACSVYLNKTRTFLQRYLTSLDASAIEIGSVHASLLALDIHFMLYARFNKTSPLTLLRTPVLDSQDADFWFFGYMYLYDWVLGYREVLSFQGDAGRLTLLSDLQPALLQQVPTDLVTTNAAVYCRLAVTYVTCVMLLVATLASGYLVRARNRVEGLNMFELCRVGGIVWVGRPLLLLRSLTAVALLSTASIDLVRVGALSMFYTVATPWYKVALAATEVTWLSAIVTDIGLVVTQTYASYYVTLNSTLVWISVAMLTLVAPVTAQMTLARQCTIADMDFKVRCESGALGIGSASRFLQLVLLVVVWNAVSFLAVRRMVGPPPLLTVRSHLLSANARYLYNHTARTLGDVYYLDRASAAIDGILTFRRNDALLALDLKLWRVFMTPIAKTLPVGPCSDFVDAYPITY